MNFNEMLEDISRAPTMMNGSEELEFMEKLKKLKVDCIVSNMGCFFEILDRLDESHSNNGYFEVTQENKDKYFEFADWAEGLSSENIAFEERKGDLLSYAITFRLLPWEIYS